MLYYRVKKEYDHKPIYKMKLGHKYPMFWLVKDELYTEKEKLKYGISDNALEKVLVSKTRTYHLFGARFADENETYVLEKEGSN